MILCLARPTKLKKMTTKIWAVEAGLQTLVTGSRGVQMCLLLENETLFKSKGKQLIFLYINLSN